MDAGKAGQYHHAINWLQKARTAYHVEGRQSDWLAYLEPQIQTHYRKYKLRPMLEGLR